MGSKIKQLPEELIAHIAAGEVIERPASILKELLENSLDAGATDIAIQIDGAGRSKISVSDNGCGMTREEALLALKRHATSKISKLDDLESLLTYGFRGEALPSIAAVSHLRLVTRSATDDTGWEFQLEGGRLKSEKPKAREPGTTLEVADVFFNTPARFKFLKSDATERGQCLKVIEEMAFAAREVTFHLQVDKAKTQLFQGPSDISTRLSQIWGSRFDQKMAPVQAQSTHFQLEGVVSHPHFQQASGRYQFLYVNGRVVQNRRLARAVYNAYQGQLMTQRHPAWVLFLTVNPETVDVNVHPSKREVKLTHESEIFGFINEAVQAALSPQQNSPVSPTSWKPSSSPSSQKSSSFSFKEPEAPKPGSVTTALKKLYTPLNTTVTEETPLLISQPAPEAFPTLQALAQIRRTFIVAQSDQGLVLVDQHAAAERILYEKLLANLKTQTPESQMLLVPYTWDVSLSLFSEVKDKLPLMTSLGFVIEPFGTECFAVKGVPSFLGDKVEIQSLMDGLSDAFNGKTDFQHRLAANTACKAAVKAGDALELKQSQRLLDDIRSCESPWTCPHGRPTYLQWDFQELERRFKRI